MALCECGLQEYIARDANSITHYTKSSIIFQGYMNVREKKENQDNSSKIMKRVDTLDTCMLVHFHVQAYRTY